MLILMRGVASQLRGPGRLGSCSGLEYDSELRRLWILGQRIHHGAVGTLGVAAGMAGAALVGGFRAEVAPLLVLSVALVAHDWKDRSLWFVAGRGCQP